MTNLPKAASRIIKNAFADTEEYLATLNGGWKRESRCGEPLYVRKVQLPFGAQIVDSYVLCPANDYGIVCFEIIDGEGAMIVLPDMTIVVETTEGDNADLIAVATRFYLKSLEVETTN